MEVIRCIETESQRELSMKTTEYSKFTVKKVRILGCSFPVAVFCCSVSCWLFFCLLLLLFFCLQFENDGKSLLLWRKINARNNKANSKLKIKRGTPR